MYGSRRRLTSSRLGLRSIGSMYRRSRARINRGVRSQDSGGVLVALDVFDVRLKETADFLKARPEINQIDVLKVSSEDQ